MTHYQAATLFFALILSFLITYYLVPLFIAIAHRYQIVDRPDGVIKRQKKPVAYLGGIALYGGFLCTIALVFPCDNQIYSLLAGSTLLLLIGLIDDLVQLSPLQKIVGQLVVTACFMRAGLYFKEQFFGSHVWGVPLSALWIVSIINAFNLLDVADGCAATTALCASCLFLPFAYYVGNIDVVLLLCSLIGALFAFLAYNKPSASIYLGDAGSLFLGGIMAVIPFCVSWGTYTQHGWLVPPLILLVPCFEVAALVVLRTCCKRPFWLPSEHHVAHRLIKRIKSPYVVLVFIFLLGLLQAVLSYLFFFSLVSPVLFFIIIPALFCLWIAL